MRPSHFPPPVTPNFDLLTSKLLCQLVPTAGVGNLSSSLKFVRFSVFEFAVGAGQADRQTDRRHGVVRNAASYREGRIRSEFRIVLQKAMENLCSYEHECGSSNT